MAIRYVDSAASGANNGTSWADAWTDPNSVSGASPGDTVYISGGTSTKTYTLSGTYNQWGLKNGTAGSLITYQIGQDAGHTGIAIFTPAATTNQFIFGCDYIILSGKLGTGSDGISHFKFFSNGLAGEGISADNINSLLIEYCQFTPIRSMAGFNPVIGFLEISYCQAIITGTDASRCCYAAFNSASGYREHGYIHHCDISVPYDNVANDGFGADGLQWVGDGFDIEYNTIRGIGEAGARGDHQDGWQSSGSHWVRIRYNVFSEIQNYCIFAELPQSSRTNTHMLIANNRCYHHNGTGTQAIAVGGDSSTGKINTDVHVWNNVADGYSFPFTIRNPGSGSDAAAFISCSAKNNVDVWTQGSGNIIDPAVVTANNVAVTSSNAVTYFASWSTAVTDALDYHLTALATPLIGSGADGSSVVGSTDADGNTRTTPWDLGPYKNGSGGGSSGGSTLSGKLSLSGKLTLS